MAATRASGRGRRVTNAQIGVHLPIRRCIYFEFPWTTSIQERAKRGGDTVQRILKVKERVRAVLVRRGSTLASIVVVTEVGCPDERQCDLREIGVCRNPGRKRLGWIGPIIRVK